MMPCHTQTDQAGANAELGCRYAMRAGRMTALSCSTHHLLTSKSPDEVCRKLPWALRCVVSSARNLKRGAALHTSQHAPFTRSVCVAWKRARSQVSDCRETRMARTGGKRHLDETDARKQNATANDVMREERFRRGRKNAGENYLIVSQFLMCFWYSRKPLKPRCPVIRATSVV